MESRIARRRCWATQKAPVHQALRKNVPSAVVTARQTLFHPQSQHYVRTMVWDLARALQYEGTMGLNELKLKQEIYALAQSFIGFLIVGLGVGGIRGPTLQSFFS